MTNYSDPAHTKAKLLCLLKKNSHALKSSTSSFLFLSARDKFEVSVQCGETHLRMCIIILIFEFSTSESHKPSMYLCACVCGA